jgi:drug/metabolite transporter (DMT)-like permease
VNCPGELQTVLNQLVIPITMVGAASFLKAKFEPFQIWGSIFILLGAIVASSNYLLSSTADTTDSNDTSKTSTTGTTSTSTAVVSVAVIIYVLSVVPSAVSNIYKEQKMKEQDMNEVHTSTLVSFWQLWFGFLYLPLLALPQLGTLSLVCCVLFGV